MIKDTLLGSSFVVALRTFDATRTTRTLIVAAFVGPILQVLYFAALATVPGRNPPLVIAVTASLLVAAIAAVESVTVSVTHMRHDSVLPHVLLSPRAPTAVWVGASVASAGVGLLSGLVSLTVARVLFSSDFMWPQYAAAAGIIAVTAIASGGFGFAIGALTLPARNGLAWVIPIIGIMTVLGGITIPVSDMPGPAQWLARLLPISFGTDAVRSILGNDSAERIAASAGAALLLGLAWFTIGAFGWRIAARRMREFGTIDLL